MKFGPHPGCDLVELSKARHLVGPWTPYHAAAHLALLVAVDSGAGLLEHCSTASKKMSTEE